MKAKRIRQRGFSLIELIVVVAILAAMAGIAVSVVGGYDTTARAQLVHVEMKTIANAIYRFKNDTGYFPKTGIFQYDPAPDASLDFLFTSPDVEDTDGDGVADPDGVEDMPWNIHSGRGWNGPYLSRESAQRLHVATGSPLASECDLVTVTSMIDGLEDPFEKELGSLYVSGDDCFVLFDSGNWTPKNFSGQPYHYDPDFSSPNVPECIAPDTCIVIESAGPDGSFSNAADNIVKILNVN